MAAPIELASRELTLTQARTLARHGRHAEAETLLTELEPGAAVLDLLARVHAQQGHLDEADRCWAEVERLAPGSAEAIAGRRRIAKLRAGTPRSGRLVVRATAGVAVVLTLALLVDTRIEVGRRPRTAPVAPVAPMTPTTPPAVRPTAGVLAAMDLRIPGVRLRRTPGEIAISFDKGLFTGDARLSQGGRAVLKALGTRLRPYATRITVDVVGRTDGLPVPPGSGYAGNTELGTLRATVVREALREDAGIPTSRFSVSSLGGVTAGHAGRARDRTVSLRVAPAGEG